MTYHEVLKDAGARLAAAGVPDSDNDAELLLEKATGKDRARLLFERDEVIPAADADRYEELILRRLKREPLQYIYGTWEFMGLDFICSPACLIPRQDTELLVMTALEDIAEAEFESFRLLDMCTGSGCVVISVVKLAAHGRIEALGTDISEEALEIAGRNAAANGVSVELRQSDMFENIDVNEVFDLITANPPYIETGVIAGLNPEINRYEPMIALDGGEDGLKHYRSIVSGAKAHLKDGGSIMMEIGDTQGKAVSELLNEAGYRNIEVLKDLAGLDRVVRASWYNDL